MVVLLPVSLPACSASATSKVAKQKEEKKQKEEEKSCTLTSVVARKVVVPWSKAAGQSVGVVLGGCWWGVLWERLVDL